MRYLRAKLPPLNSLVAFEASARHLSFTRAGQELRISREAVSRKIRILENHLGVSLFVRLYRALELTAAGRELQSVVARSLEDIACTSAGLKRPRPPRSP
jgi:LysR family glycine cleavage system transcriptional activator